MKHVLSTLGIAATLAVGITACGNRQDKVAAEAAQQLQEYKDSVRLAADTAGLAEYQQWKAQNELVNEPEPTTPAAAPARSSTAKSSSVRRSASSSSNGGGSYSSTSSNTAKSKEGWSKAAKGAVIGGAGGAVAGAVINKKNRTVGAVVGGVVGGAVGYGIGRSKDKKDGRY